MPGPREEIQNYINKELPDKFSSADIKDMYDSLVKDMNALRRVVGMHDEKMGMILQQKHRVLMFAFPSIYFKAIKGEMRPDVLDSILSLKEKLDNNEISLDEARMGVIDGAKEDIKNNPKESRPQKPKGDVQEMTVLCKTDGSIQD